MIPLKIILLFIPSLLLSSHAISGVADGYCPQWQFADVDNVKLGFIRNNGIERSYFFDDLGDCPLKEGCQKKVYIIPGDEVLIADTVDGWSCVRYQGKNRRFAGWMKTRNLGLTISERNLTIDDWIGEWHTPGEDRSITISRKSGDLLKLKGDAQYNQYLDLLTGALSLDDKGYMNFAADDYKAKRCNMTLRLMDGYLIVEENGCGGGNTTYRGVYVPQ